MARGKRRDEWDRWGQLLALVYNRTIFGAGDKPRDPDSFWPPGLVSRKDKADQRAAMEQSLPEIDGAGLQSLMGLK